VSGFLSYFLKNKIFTRISPLLPCPIHLSARGPSWRFSITSSDSRAPCSLNQIVPAYTNIYVNAFEQRSCIVPLSRIVIVDSQVPGVVKFIVERFQTSFFDECER